MSRKTRRNQTHHQQPLQQAQQGSASRKTGARVFMATAAVVLLAVIAGTLLYRSDQGQSPPVAASADSAAALASEHAPTLGVADAPVHIVEFIDPACETCALFYPMVKQMLADNPGRIRLSMRHAPFHEGSEYVVRLLEASRKQDKYWQTLETLLASQSRWAPQHTVQPDLARQAIAGVGLDMEQLLRDMNEPEVSARMKRDYDDGVALKVTATPEYFVNGRSLPSFGEQQLRTLVSDELQSAR
jgi:protein-disulfide isomerase